METVEIHQNVIFVEPHCFSACNKLKEIQYAETLEKFKKIFPSFAVSLTLQIGHHSICKVIIDGGCLCADGDVAGTREVGPGACAERHLRPVGVARELDGESQDISHVGVGKL